MKKKYHLIHLWGFATSVNWFSSIQFDHRKLFYITNEDFLNMYKDVRAQTCTADVIVYWYADQALLAQANTSEYGGGINAS